MANPSKSQASIAIFNWTRQKMSRRVEGCEFQIYLANDLAKSRFTLRVAHGGGDFYLATSGTSTSPLTLVKSESTAVSAAVFNKGNDVVMALPRPSGYRKDERLASRVRGGQERP